MPRGKLSLAGCVSNLIFEFSIVPATANGSPTGSKILRRVTEALKVVVSGHSQPRDRTLFLLARTGSMLHGT
jgi:hypothetical protein